MARKSEFSSYVYIKNDLATMGWNVRNPERSGDGQLYTQQECLDHPEMAAGLGRQRPEYVVKVLADAFWVIEAKATHEQLDQAFDEALGYARAINQSTSIKACLISGVAGNDDDGYLVRTAYLHANGQVSPVRYNGKSITGFLSVLQARQLVTGNTHELTELVTDEVVLLSIAEAINEELHKASINKDLRATVMSSVLLAMVSDTLPNLNASPEIFVKEINFRAEDVLINYGKQAFAAHIELKLPQEAAARIKYKAAVSRVFFLLRKINIKAAMDGSHDLLGKFYEVFLKYGNGAKDIGIVLTPRHITEFSAEILDIQAGDLVYDPACGTGGFLVAAYDRVRRNEPSGVDAFKKHRIFGVEQQANVATLAIVNMIFRGDGHSHIINSDCLSVNLNRKISTDKITAGQVSAEYQQEPAQRKSVTKVLMNPPFALKREDEQEFTFIEHALDQMVDGGLLLCVVPISVMYASGRELAWRKRLLSQHSLLTVMSLPTDLFYPQASVETVIIVVRKGVPQETDAACLFVRISDDGFFKLKKRRLPYNRPHQLAQLSADIHGFIHAGVSRDIPGVLQAKRIDLNDPSLELIPQQHLDNAQLDVAELKKALSAVQSELVFQEIRRGLGQ